MAALRANIAKLGAFFHTPAYKHLPVASQELLKIQLPAMLAYAAKLDARSPPG